MQARLVSRGLIAVAVLVFAIQGSAAPTKKTIHVQHPLQVAGTMIAAGDYKVTLDGSEITFEQGKEVVVKATCTVKDNGTKASQSAVIYDNKDIVTEIRFAGESQVAILQPTTTASTPSRSTSTDR